MTTRSAGSTSSVLLIVLLVLTFPFWIGIGAGIIGLMAGLMGAAIGLVAGMFGLIAGLIALPFKMIFGWGHGWFPHFHGIWILLTIILIVLLVRKKQ